MSGEGILESRIGTGKSSEMGKQLLRRIGATGRIVLEASESCLPGRMEQREVKWKQAMELGSYGVSQVTGNEGLQ